VRVRLGLGLAAGGGAASPSVLAASSVDTQKIEVFTGSSAMPQPTNKKLGGAACRAFCVYGLRAKKNFSGRLQKEEKFMLDFATFYVY